MTPSTTTTNTNATVNASLPTTPPITSKQSLFESKYLVAGGVSGFVSRSLTAPLERLKILNQVYPLLNNGTKYNTIGSGLKTIWREEGIRGLFKGNGANVIKAAPQSAIRFYTYEAYKRILLNDNNRNGNTSSLNNTINSSTHRMWAGACAGVTSIVLTYPLEVVKTKLSLQTQNFNYGNGGQLNPPKYKGIIGTIRTVIKNEGFGGLFVGMSAGIINIAPFSALNFMAYDTCKDITIYLNDGKPSNNRHLSLVHGAISGAFSMTILYPLDVIKRRLMVQGTPKIYRNTFHAFYKIVHDEGIKALYYGIKPAYAKVIPTVSINFYTYEVVLDFLPYLFNQIPSTITSTTTTTTNTKTPSSSGGIK